MLQFGDAPPRNLTEHPGQDSDPSWEASDDCFGSPSRQQHVAFTSNRHGSQDIFVYNLAEPANDDDNDNVVNDPLNITNTPGVNETAPAWSPGPAQRFYPRVRNRSAFTRDGEIYIMNPDESDQVNLTRSSDDDANPDWSPDGQYIAFESTRLGQQIWILNVEAAIAGPVSPTPATQGDLPKSNPSWMTYGERGSPERTDALVYRVLYEGTSYLDLAVDGPFVGRRPFALATTGQPLTGNRAATVLRHGAPTAMALITAAIAAALAASRI